MSETINLHFDAARDGVRPEDVVGLLADGYEQKAEITPFGADGSELTMPLGDGIDMRGVRVDTTLSDAELSITVTERQYYNGSKL